MTVLNGSNVDLISFTLTDLLPVHSQSTDAGPVEEIISNILIFADRELPLLLTKQGLPMAGKQCDRYIRAQQLLYFRDKETMRLLIFYVVLELNPILKLLST